MLSRNCLDLAFFQRLLSDSSIMIVACRKPHGKGRNRRTLEQKLVLSSNNVGNFVKIVCVSLTHHAHQGRVASQRSMPMPNGIIRAKTAFTQFLPLFPYCPYLIYPSSTKEAPLIFQQRLHCPLNYATVASHCKIVPQRQRSRTSPSKLGALRPQLPLGKPFSPDPTTN